MEIMVSKMVMSCFYLDGGDDDYNDDERRGDVNFTHSTISIPLRIPNAQKVMTGAKVASHWEQ